jgi:hypothetical protein
MMRAASHRDGQMFCDGRSGHWRPKSAGGLGGGGPGEEGQNFLRGAGQKPQPAPLTADLRWLDGVRPAVDAATLPSRHKQARPLPSPMSMARAPDSRDETRSC